MNQLVEGCLLVDRAYIFDNSYNYSLIAEMHDGEYSIREENPAVQFSWFQKYFVDKFNKKR
jgi:predicted ABC-type ATPase